MAFPFYALFVIQFSPNVLLVMVVLPYTSVICFCASSKFFLCFDISQTYQKNVKRYLRRMFRVCVVVLQKFVFLSGESVNDFKARNFDL